MKTKFCFTEEELAKIPPAEPGKRILYRDTVNRYLALRVSATSMSFVAVKKDKASGKAVFVTLGPYPGLSLKTAKQKAGEAAVSLGKGINPNEAERQKRRQDEEVKAEQTRQEDEARNQSDALKARQTTLQKNLDTYLDKRNLKLGTRKLYEKLVMLHLSDWLDRPVCEITKDMITDRHTQIAKGERGRPRFITVPKTPEEIEADCKAAEDRKPTRGQRSTVKICLTKRVPDPEPKHRGASADGVMRVLRAIINFARDDHEDLIPVNPVERLSKRKEWYKVPRRRRLIKNSDLPAWYKAVMALDNDTMKDYLLFLLFTGLRRNEAAQLTWKQIDFEEGAFTVVDTKNREPHTLPLSDYLYKLLNDRKKGLKAELAEAKAALTAGRKDTTLTPKQLQALKNRAATAEDKIASPYVFPGDGKSGHINEPKRAIDAVTESTGIAFSCHDLRRSFTTVAESLDLSKYAIKSLLNHKQDDNSDVTGGYIVMNVERLRGALQKVNDELIRRIENPSTVIDFEEAKKKRKTE
jgi:integrase